MEDRGLEWVEQGSLEQDSIIHLSWLETALWAPLTPVLESLSCVPSPEPPSSPFSVALVELQAPQTLTIEYCTWGDGVCPLLTPNSACPHILFHFFRGQLIQTFQIPPKENEPPLCLITKSSFYRVSNVLMPVSVFSGWSFLAFSIPYAENVWPRTNRHCIST